MKTMMTLVLLLLAATIIDGRRLQDPTLECESLYKSMEHCLPYVTGIADRPIPVCCDGVHRLRDILRTREEMVNTCECLKTKASALHHLKESIWEVSPWTVAFSFINRSLWTWTVATSPRLVALVPGK